MSSIQLNSVSIQFNSVSFRRREVEVYPDEYDGKPKVGEELNKKSEISLHKVWPNDKSTLTPIKVIIF